MPPVRHLRAACACLFLSLTCTVSAFATAPGNGRLQIIHLDVGQGDGAILITPNGQVAMFDDGPGGTGALGLTVVQQLQALGVTGIEHHFCSHYHSDHLGGTPSIATAGIPITNGWDRGGSYTTGAYTSYVTALGTHRKTMVKGQLITLDSLSAHPVYIKCIDLGAPGVSPAPTEENTLSMVMKVSYGEFDETFGGDLPGTTTGSYKNIETTIGPEVGGHVEVYKVHHHGSTTSSMDDWLNATTPNIAVISCGNGNSYGHPTSAALTRLHNHSVHTYWTETGSGVAPNATWDKVSNGQIRISATWQPAGVDTIRGTGFADTFINSGTAVDATAPVASVTSPDGGEDWKAGSSHPITWSATDNVAVTTVDLAWSSDFGSTWNAIATGIANSGSYAWTVPSSATTSGRVRVVAHDAVGNLGADSSAAGFTVDYWTVAASAGLGGAVSPAGVQNEVQGATPGFTITPLAGCQVQAVLVDGVSQGALTAYQFPAVVANHTLAASFLDVAAPVVTLTSLQGGQRLTPGDNVDITWNATDNLGVDSVAVYLAPLGPSYGWTLLAGALPNSGSWTWTVPALATDSAFVRVIAYDHAINSGSATSDSAFAIGVSSAGVGSGPARLALAPPAPNPAMGAVGLHFSLPVEGMAGIEVLDVSGRRVGQYSGVLSAGSHSWTWDGCSAGGARAGAGLYLVRLHTAQGTRTQRLVLLR